jgi:hypothetical protein
MRHAQTRDRGAPRIRQQFGDDTIRKVLGHLAPATARPAIVHSPKHQIRSLVLCVDLVGSRRIWLLTLDAPSVQTDPDGSRRIVWMIKRMIKQDNQFGQASPTRASEELSRACGSSLLMLDDH